MLEVKNLCKTYKSKKGVVTKALDGVSIRFPEKGLVFLLGKSGCGKSTLLNVCGGLDRADFGEIFLMGKSSREFSAEDFDSYRNTFIGFVFQEYNLLEEFTVEDNVALALELQNKKRDEEKITSILKTVEMEEFAKRKPNTLSGGQKQRVAIARALVKDPRIIFADEPTGALDSETGEQVLETLKKLSADKLVIVVSHDREFAQQYADRIIELKDGKVFADSVQEETAQSSEEGSPSVALETAQIGEEESPSVALETAQKVEEESPSVVSETLQIGEEESPSVALETAQSGEEGNAPSIAAKAESKRTEERVYSAEERRMIPSRLPLRYAFRMGVTGLKVKPVRLLFTIFLTCIAFLIFGLFSTIAFYNKKAVIQKTLLNSEITYLNYQKGYHFETLLYRMEDGEKILDGQWGETKETTLTAEEYAELVRTYPGSVAAISHTENISGLTLGDTRFYTDAFQGFAFAKEEDAVELLAGRLPQNANEAMISDYTFACMQAGTLKDGEGNIVKLNGYGDYTKIPTQVFCEVPFNVVGVYKGETVPTQYAALKEASDQHLYTDATGTYSWQIECTKGFYAYLLVSESFADKYLDYIEQFGRSSTDKMLYEYFELSERNAELYCGEYGVQICSYFSTYEQENGRELLPLYNVTATQKVTALNEGEIALSVNTYGYLLKNYLDTAVDKKLSETMSAETQEKLRDETVGILEKANALTDYDVTLPTVREYLADICAFMQKWELDEPQLTLQDKTCGLTKQVKIGGLFLEYDSYGCGYFAEDLFDVFFQPSVSRYVYEYSTAYQPKEGAYINNLFIGKEVYRRAVEALVDATFTVNDDDSTVMFGNNLMSEATMINELIEMMRSVFFGMWVVFTIFAALLLFNFISVSITAKKREIGILRAIGARSVDVFKIFLSESFVVTAVCLLLSSVGGSMLCSGLSNAIIEGTGIGTTLLVYTPLTFLCVLLVAAITAVISTALPVAIYTRKPPVDSIRAL